MPLAHRINRSAFHGNEVSDVYCHRTRRVHFFRHMLRNRTALPGMFIKPLVGCYPPSLVEYLHHILGKPHIDFVLVI
jgi:hypothetical protein